MDKQILSEMRRISALQEQILEQLKELTYYRRKEYRPPFQSARSEFWAKYAAEHSSVGGHSGNRPFPKEKEDDVVAKLKPIFWGNKDEARDFLRSIYNRGNKEITDTVVQRINEKKLSQDSCKRNLWTILYENGLYSAKENNWGRMINNGLNPKPKTE